MDCRKSSTVYLYESYKGIKFLSWNRLSLCIISKKERQLEKFITKNMLFYKYPQHHVYLYTNYGASSFKKKVFLVQRKHDFCYGEAYKIIKMLFPRY